MEEHLDHSWFGGDTTLQRFDQAQEVGLNLLVHVVCPIRAFADVLHP